MRKAFDSAEISSRLKNFPEWKFQSGALERSLQFQDFKSAFNFMTQIAEVAEKLNHHPDWTNVYNRLSIRLNTHDAHGITELDFKLAQSIDQIFSKFT